MDLSYAHELFQPLSLEQSLHLLDSLTWFPTSGADRYQRVAEYVRTRASGTVEPSPDIVRGVMDRITSPVAPAVADDRTGDGRWADIPHAKHLYQLKYDLKTLLLPERWFTFMNMGFQSGGATEPDLRPFLPAGQAVWQYSANLYDLVGAQIPLTGRDVLEVGSGRGGGAAFLYRRYQPRTYCAVEQSANNVAFSRAVHPAAVSFVQGDAERLPCADNAFDAVLNVESAHCYPHPAAFFREVRRVLRPGGHLLFADEWWTTTTAELLRDIRSAGLKIQLHRDITDGIIEALRRLPAITEPLIGRQEGQQRRVYQRFFGERVLKDSLHSYTSGRFGFHLVAATPG